jgi:hypothetical protein
MIKGERALFIPRQKSDIKQSDIWKDEEEEEGTELQREHTTRSAAYIKIAAKKLMMVDDMIR